MMKFENFRGDNYGGTKQRLRHLLKKLGLSAIGIFKLNVQWKNQNNVLWHQAIMLKII